MSVKAPKGSVPQRKELYNDAFGGWIQLSLTAEKDMAKYQGELICIARDSIYLLTPSGDLVQVAEKDVSSSRLIFYNTETEKYAGWTTIGALTTVSHGYYLIFSFPTWLIVGTTNTSAELRRENYLDCPPYTSKQLRKYARFPQGLPVGLDLEQLKKRPAKK